MKILIIIVLNIGLAISDPLFIRGRPHNKYGMLGLPIDEGHIEIDGYSLNNSTSQMPKEEWLEQRLNHFDPTDTRRWKQVCYLSMAIFL